MLDALRPLVEGELLTDNVSRILYSTDASAYRERPLGVFIPKNKSDLKTVVAYAAEHKLSLIPRAAGTSIAGQVVGSGLVVDISRNFNRILEIDETEKWVRVEPGVVLDELNKILAPKQLFFGPETSTANRCMIGGMVGNNSCGAHSLIYGSTRDHVLELDCILADGSEVTFGEVTKPEFDAKCQLDTLEGNIYRQMRDILSDEALVAEIEANFPAKEIRRRNTGYAVDELLDNELFGCSDKRFNMCKLLVGSEGTLAFTTAIKLNLVDTPPKIKALMCVHTRTLCEVYEANLVALKHSPVSIELMDKAIMDLTKANINQSRNRFFVEGDPAALLIVEWYADDIATINGHAAALEAELRHRSMGYAYPMVFGADIARVWELRKAGLGILGNMPGDAKPVPVIEDTAVRPGDLPDYMDDFTAMMANLGLECVYYAHIATGELHLRPVLNMKDPHDAVLFRTVAFETAKLVKKYRGSLSGEHGDGRLRGEFIPFMMGERLYTLFQTIKQTWDAHRVFNPGKITDTPPMDSSLRFQAGQPTRMFDTVLDFSATGGYLRLAEKCNSSGDCRKSNAIGGTLCPSFKATRDEQNSTRARANILRDVLTNATSDKPFDSEEIYRVLDLCLMCKACKSECPSGVDITKLKMEFLQQYYDAHHVPLRSLAVANLPRLHALFGHVPWLVNFFLTNRLSSSLLKSVVKFNQQRSFPLMSRHNLTGLYRATQRNKPTNPIRRIYLFNDEFTNYLDSAVGLKAIRLFERLGYEVRLAPVAFSGRTWLSKGLLRSAKRLANKNIDALKAIISADTPLVGIEPSAVLSFRDEYPDLADDRNRDAARALAANTFLFDEFMAAEIAAGHISSEQFTERNERIRFHGHCQQKALISTKYTKRILSLPTNYEVSEIPSGCCGMAGSFGYEKEHYELSMQIGEMVLFPEVRKAENDTVIVAVGTSCRCQIADGTGVEALHPLEVLYDALLDK